MTSAPSATSAILIDLGSIRKGRHQPMTMNKISPSLFVELLKACTNSVVKRDHFTILRAGSSNSFLASVLLLLQ
jgi:hypothetical protein